MKLQITCKEATTFIIQREEGKLSLKKRLQLWLHFGICGLCKLFYKQSGLIGKNAANIEKSVTDNLTKEDKNKIIAGLEQL